jgi:hypothetical protein
MVHLFNTTGLKRLRIVIKSVNTGLTTVIAMRDHFRLVDGSQNMR